MPKDVAKLLEPFVVDKIEIGESAAGAEPIAYTDIGLIDDEQFTVKADPVRRREMGGGNVQISYDCSVETSMMQVLDSSVAEGFKNKNCWIKATSKGGSIVRVKNVMINVALDGQPHAKGNSKIMITGATYVKAIADFFAQAMS